LYWPVAPRCRMDLCPHSMEVIYDGGRKSSVIEEVDDAGLQGHLFVPLLSPAVTSETECTHDERRGASGGR